MKEVVAFDFGASSGRCLLGTFDGEFLKLEEIDRMANIPVTMGRSMYWNIVSFYEFILSSLSKISAKGIKPASISIDSWASDYGLLDRNRNLLEIPHCYRDLRTEGIVEEAYPLITPRELFTLCGSEPNQRHTLYQLLSAKKFQPDILEKASTCLSLPGLLNYFLTGNFCYDASQASITVLYDPDKREWMRDIIQKCGLPDIFPRIYMNDNIVGVLSRQVAEKCGLGQIPVISAVGHDSAAATLALTEHGNETMYIISGTWSVLGTNIHRSIRTQRAYECHFNNQTVIGDEIMYVKNITGLFILNRCMCQWKSEGKNIDYEQLIRYAERSDYGGYIDSDLPQFGDEECMVDKIIDYCRKTKQDIPQNEGEVFMAIINGLARRYTAVIDELEETTSQKFSKICMIGGGARNGYKCQRIADFSRRIVLAGSFEATGIGNVISQLITLGELKDKAQASRVLIRSFDQKVYLPN